MAREVSLEEFYVSTMGLFSSNALIWYQSVCRQISLWEELKEEFNIVFQSAKYDDRLELEILH